MKIIVALKTTIGLQDLSVGSNFNFGSAFPAVHDASLGFDRNNEWNAGITGVKAANSDSILPPFHSSILLSSYHALRKTKVLDYCSNQRRNVVLGGLD